MTLFGSTDVGIDLGTSSILVYAKDRGIVLNEPSVAAVERAGGKLVAVGREAEQILGRAPQDIAVIRPLRDGVISNFDVTARMMRYFSKGHQELGFLQAARRRLRAFRRDRGGKTLCR